MQLLKQIAAVTRLNLRCLPLRLGASSVIVVGIAGVVGVLVSILALVAGLSQMMSSNGRSDRAIVISTGSSFEMLSSLPRATIWTIKSAPGIRRGTDGQALASAEALAVVRGVLKDGSPANLSLRGAGPELFQVRPELRIVEGRAFAPTVRELIVGRSAQRQFRGLDPGSRITLRSADWTVVGVFESGGDRFESELITGAETLQSAFRRSTFQSVSVQLDAADSFDAFNASLRQNPALSVEVSRETDYTEQQSGSITRVLTIVAYLVGGIMALGAVFGALNSMHTAVSSRTVEIATLRALGFGSTSVVASVFAEALLLAALGGGLGACLAWLIFDGHVISTSGAGATQLAVPLVVGPRIIVHGVLWACIIGMIGACLPAIHAARTPLVAALRDS
jgi:putative ABC transport system permease protein